MGCGNEFEALFVEKGYMVMGDRVVGEVDNIFFCELCCCLGEEVLCSAFFVCLKRLYWRVGMCVWGWGCVLVTLVT